MNKFNVKDWFENNGLMVMDYQQNVVDNSIPENIDKNPTILAVAPSGGKTIMSICNQKYIDYIISRYNLKK